jgi:hypothetical protein
MVGTTDPVRLMSAMQAVIVVSYFVASRRLAKALSDSMLPRGGANQKVTSIIDQVLFKLEAATMLNVGSWIMQRDNQLLMGTSELAKLMPSLSGKFACLYCLISWAWTTRVEGISWNSPVAHAPGSKVTRSDYRATFVRKTASQGWKAHACLKVTAIAPTSVHAADVQRIGNRQAVGPAEEVKAQLEANRLGEPTGPPRV